MEHYNIQGYNNAEFNHALFILIIIAMSPDLPKQSSLCPCYNHFLLFRTTIIILYAVKACQISVPRDCT